MGPPSTFLDGWPCPCRANGLRLVGAARAHPLDLVWRDVRLCLVQPAFVVMAQQPPCRQWEKGMRVERWLHPFWPPTQDLRDCLAARRVAEFDLPLGLLGRCGLNGYDCRWLAGRLHTRLLGPLGHC